MIATSWKVLGQHLNMDGRTNLIPSFQSSVPLHFAQISANFPMKGLSIGLTILVLIIDILLIG